MGANEKSVVRHEFVGMMFAIAVGEIGIQASDLIPHQHYRHFMAAYSHLLLVLVVVAASWVGWTQSPSLGAQKDVKRVLEWEFLVVLFDVLLVICYFILVRCVDLQPGENGGVPKYDPSAAPEGAGLSSFSSFIYFGTSSRRS